MGCDNTAVKRIAHVRRASQIGDQRSNAGHAQMDAKQPRANFPSKNLNENMENNQCHGKCRKKIETFIKVCKRKRKEVKGKLETFQTQSLLSN